MQNTWVWSLGQEALLEKELATHSSILAWETHGQRKLVGYTPWNLKVGHDLVTQQQQQHTLWCRKLNLGVSQGAQWVKEPACNAGDMGLISKSGRSPRGWQGNPLQYSFLENPMDRGTWLATVHRSQSDMTEVFEHVCTRTCSLLHRCTIKNLESRFEQIWSCSWSLVLRCYAGRGFYRDNQVIVRLSSGSVLPFIPHQSFFFFF